MGGLQTKIEQPHPYYPPEVLIPSYVANSYSAYSLLSALITAEALCLTTTFFVIKRWRPSISQADILTALWFVLCGSLHIFFEGYFVLNNHTIASSQTIPAQLWKEYALSDSRYLTRDPVVLTLEILTVLVWGPLCCLTASSIASRDPLRYPLQIIVSVGHLYGCTIYYASSLTEWYLTGVLHSRPEVQYFHGYFLGANAPWIVVPLYLLYDALGKTLRAFAVLELTGDDRGTTKGKNKVS